MNSVVARGRKVLATVGSVVLGAGLAVTLAPSAGSALPAGGGGDRPAPVLGPAGPQAKALAGEWAAGPQAKALSEALPARLGALSFTSVYGATAVKSSTGRRLTASLSAFEAKGSKTSSFYISLSRGAKEMHGWSFQAPASAFDISPKAAGKLVLPPKKTGGMGKVALKVKPDGKMKSYKCGGEVYAKERNVVIAGTFFFDTGSKWGKVGSKKKPFKFQTTSRVYFSYDVNCPPTEYPNPCYSGLSWSAWRNTTNSSTYVFASKEGAKSSIFAFRSTKLAKPKNAWRTDMAWGTGDAPVLTESETDDSATMKIFGVRGSGTIAAPPESSFTSDYPCDEGTQHSTWWSGMVTNDATRVKVPAQVFGSFTVPDGTMGSMSKSWFE